MCFVFVFHVCKGNFGFGALVWGLLSSGFDFIFGFVFLNLV